MTDFSSFSDEQLKSISEGKPDFKSMSTEQLKILAGDKLPPQPEKPLLEYRGEVPVPGVPGQFFKPTNAAQVEQSRKEHPVQSLTNVLAGYGIGTLQNTLMSIRGLSMGSLPEDTITPDIQQNYERSVQGTSHPDFESGKTAADWTNAMAIAPTPLGAIALAGWSAEHNAQKYPEESTSLNYLKNVGQALTLMGASNIVVDKVLSLGGNVLNKIFPSSKDQSETAGQKLVDNLASPTKDIGKQIKSTAKQIKINELTPLQKASEEAYNNLKNEKFVRTPEQQQILNSVKDRSESATNAWNTAVENVNSRAGKYESTLEGGKSFVNSNKDLPVDSVLYQKQLISELRDLTKPLNAANSKTGSKYDAQDAKALMNVVKQQVEDASPSLKAANVLHGEYKTAQANFDASVLGAAAKSKSDTALETWSNNLFNAPMEDFNYTIAQLSKENPTLLNQLVQKRMNDLAASATKPNKNISMKDVFSIILKKGGSGGEGEKLIQALGNDPANQARFAVLAELADKLHPKVKVNKLDPLLKKIPGLDSLAKVDTTELVNAGVKFLTDPGIKERFISMLKNPSMTQEQIVANSAQMILKNINPKPTKPKIPTSYELLFNPLPKGTGQAIRNSTPVGITRAIDNGLEETKPKK